MPTRRVSAIVGQLQRLLAGKDQARSDQELLQRFLASRDETAFAALVARHSPMVLEVCLSVLHHRQDAEDALQATFIVLAQGASAIRRRQSLGSWLHGVAYRVSLKARTAQARRRVVDGKAAVRESVVSQDEQSWREVRSVLHSELAALPEYLRGPLVLCYLEGLTQDEAARRLGWPATTLKGRLQRGRERLRRRLERRGLGLPAVLGSLLAGQTAATSFSSSLANSTTMAALASVQDVTQQAGWVSPTLLAREMLRHPIPMKLKVLGAVVAVVGLLAGGGVWLSEKQADREAPAIALTAAFAPAPPVDQHGDPLPSGAIARLGTVRFNHGAGLRSLHFSRDGRRILSFGGGFLRWWDTASGQELGHLHETLSPHDFDNAVLSADGTTLTTIGKNFSTVGRWNIEQGFVQVISLPVKRSTWRATQRDALSPDGSLCAAHTDDQIRVFEVGTSRELWQLPGNGGSIRSVVFAGNNQVVTADEQKTITVRESATGKIVRQFNAGGPAEVLAASADGRWLAALEHHNYAIDRLLDSDKVRIWDVATGARKQTLSAPPKSWFMSLQFSPDGNQLFAGYCQAQDYTLGLWDVNKGQLLREFPGVAGIALALSPDGKCLAEGAPPGKFNVWDVGTGKRLSSEDAEHARAAAVYLSASGDQAVTVGFQSISVWDAQVGRRLYSFDVPPLPSIPPDRTVSPDGRYAVTFMGDWEHKQALLWDVHARRRLPMMEPMGGSRNTITAFSQDSSLLAAYLPGKETSVRIWDIRTGHERTSFKESSAGWPEKLYFGEEGKTLFVVGRRVVRYAVDTGKELGGWQLAPSPSKGGIHERAAGATENEENVRAWRVLTISPDGTLAACILNRPYGSTSPVPWIALCDARTGKVLRRWDDSGKRSGNYEALVFSPGGRLLASSEGADIHLWEVATGKEVCTFRGHRGDVNALAFSGDGRRLASASWDSTVLIWKVQTP